ncbi:hypothetical protein FGIG_05433 [Fasciola gigantica]|uniref:Late nodulin n=1 Tax=Fasciola gigantica TaxID=46835 RepID=A0A504Z5A7_FASGI|nr:hypothetical protein FGIG_05433 [Fasciola gigantica]
MFDRALFTNIFLAVTLFLIHVLLLTNADANYDCERERECERSWRIGCSLYHGSCDALLNK